MSKLYSSEELLRLIKSGMVKLPFNMKWIHEPRVIFIVTAIGITTDGTEYGLLHLPVPGCGRYFSIDEIKEFTLLDDLQCPWPDYL